MGNRIDLWHRAKSHCQRVRVAAREPRDNVFLFDDATFASSIFVGRCVQYSIERYRHRPLGERWRTEDSRIGRAHPSEFIRCTAICAIFVLNYINLDYCRRCVTNWTRFICQKRTSANSINATSRSMSAVSLRKFDWARSRAPPTHPFNWTNWHSSKIQHTNGWAQPSILNWPWPNTTFTGKLSETEIQISVLILNIQHQHPIAAPIVSTRTPVAANALRHSVQNLKNSTRQFDRRSKVIWTMPSKTHWPVCVTSAYKATAHVSATTTTAIRCSADTSRPTSRSYHSNNTKRSFTRPKVKRSWRTMAGWWAPTRWLTSHCRNRVVEMFTWNVSWSRGETASNCGTVNA